MRWAVIILLCAFLVAVGCLFYIDRSINQHIEETPHTCPLWLQDSPQRGCEK